MFTDLLSVVKPTDPKVAVGLSFLAQGKGSPLYDPVALLATLRALSSPDTPTAPTALTVAEAQAMLDSAPGGIKAPVIKAALVISTDVSLRSAEGTADTDDRIMVILLCYFIARIARPGNVHSFILLLSARKKGEEGKKDATTPADVVQFMRERIGFFGTDSDASKASSSSLSSDSAASFEVNGVDVRVFQLQAQTSPSPSNKLDAAGLVETQQPITELREANSALFAVLEAVEAADVPIFFTGCGPIDVALAVFLAEHARGGYTISFGSGINGGDGEQLEYQHTHCGGKVLLSALGALSGAAVADIGPSVTRVLVTPPGIVLLDDAKGAQASAENTFKVAGSPMIARVECASDDARRATGLALRIFVSNCTSFLGHSFLENAVQCADGADGSEALVAQFPYSHSLALTMVVYLLVAHGAPIDPATLADAASNALLFSAVPMPPSLEATIKATINGISTVAGLYKFIALGMDARLGAIMAEWHSIAQLPAVSQLNLTGPVVSTAAPIITPSGSLALAQPF